MAGNFSEPIGNFEQPVLPIADPERFQAVHQAIEKAFSASQIDAFLKSLTRAGARIRDFETVLGKGLLGSATRSQYEQLTAADQGQVREFYLVSLERIPADLRSKYFKLYAYY